MTLRTRYSFMTSVVSLTPVLNSMSVLVEIYKPPKGTSFFNNPNNTYRGPLVVPPQPLLKSLRLKPNGVR